MILQLGDPRLRTRSTPVSFSKRALTQSDVDRMQAAFRSFRQEYGFGRAMAAPQIGVHLRAIVIDVPGLPSLLVNPELRLDVRQSMTLWDDCMSFPHLLVRVERAKTAALSYFDLNGREHTVETLAPSLAELLQHEIDHLDGVLAVDLAAEDCDIVSRRTFEADRAYFMSRVSYNPFAEDVSS